MKKGSLTRTYTQLMFMATCWGGTFVAGRVLADNVGPFSAAFLRFLIASIFLLGIVWKQEKCIPLPSRKQVFPIIILGLTGIVLYNYCFFSGLHHISAGRASVIIANNPILLAIFSALIFKEKLTPQKIVGILLSVSGAVVVITNGHPFSLFNEGVGRGELFIAGAVGAWIIYSLTGKVIMTGLSPLLSVTYSVVAGAIMLVAPAAFEGVFSHMASYGMWQWASLFYLGFFGTVVGFVFYYEGINRIGPTRAGLFINFVPVNAVFLGFLILGEPLTQALLAGLAMVVGGVYLTNSESIVSRFYQGSRSDSRSL